MPQPIARARVWHRVAPWLAGAIVVVHAVSSLPGVSGSGAASAIGYASPLVTPLLAAFACTSRAWSVAGRQRLGWTLLAGAMAMWAVFQTSFILSMLNGQATPPVDPQTAVVCAVVPFLTLAAMLALAPLRGGGVRSMLDGLIISGSLLPGLGDHPSVDRAGHGRHALDPDAGGAEFPGR
jgi:hypothetical protein